MNKCVNLRSNHPFTHFFMKKFLLLVASATLIGAASCSAKSESADAVATQTTEISEASEAQQDQPQAQADSAVAEAPEETNTPTLSENGLPTVKIGMAESEIPASVAGVYNSKKARALEPEMSIPGPEIVKEITCSQNGKETIYIYFTADNKVCGMYVKTPDISTAEGIHVGSPLSDVKKVPGIGHEIDEMNDLEYYYVNGMHFYLDVETNKVRLISVGHTY